MKKMKGMATPWTAIISILVVMLVGFFYFGYTMTRQQPTTVSISGAVQAPSGGLVVTPTITPTTSIYECPSDGTTNGYARYIDTLTANPVTYGDPVVYFMPRTSGLSLQRITAGSLATTGAWSTAVDLPCSSAGIKWQPIATATNDTWHSVVGEEFFSGISDSKVDLKGKKFRRLYVMVKDKRGGGLYMFNVSGCGSGQVGTITDYTVMNGTACTVRDIAARTSLKVDADGYIDAAIYLKTNQTKGQFGEDGLRTWVLSDASTAAWQEPILQRDNGNKLQDAKTSMYPDDLRYYSGYEYAYEFGSIGDVETVLNYRLDTASGVDPGGENDPVLDFCAESRYSSSKEADQIKIGCWSDAATQVQVATSAVHRLKFNVTA